MPFPKTLNEMTEQGYVFHETATCEGVHCQMTIRWYKTREGKWMPIDERADDKVVPHWATCPDRAQFRKKA